MLRRTRTGSLGGAGEGQCPSLDVTEERVPIPTFQEPGNQLQCVGERILNDVTRITV